MIRKPNPSEGVLLGLAFLALLMMGLIYFRVGVLTDSIHNDESLRARVAPGVIRFYFKGEDGVTREVQTPRNLDETREEWLARHWSDWEALMKDAR